MHGHGEGEGLDWAYVIAGHVEFENDLGLRVFINPYITLFFVNLILLGTMSRRVPAIFRKMPRGP